MSNHFYYISHSKATNELYSYHSLEVGTNCSYDMPENTELIYTDTVSVPSSFHTWSLHSSKHVFQGYKHGPHPHPTSFVMASLCLCSKPVRRESDVNRWSPATAAKLQARSSQSATDQRRCSSARLLSLQGPISTIGEDRGVQVTYCPLCSPGSILAGHCVLVGSA